MTAARQRGLALVSVLWGISILSLIAAAMLTAAVTSARLDRNAWSAARAGSIADAAVNRAILSLMDDRGARAPRVDGTPMTIVFERVPVRLWIQDEGGKIDLNGADKTLLQSLFASVGTPDGAAGALADEIVARRGVPSAAAATPPPAYRAVDDVLAVPGMTRALFVRVAPALTVYGKGGGVDRNVAPVLVLRALPGMDDKAIAELLRSRDDAVAQAMALGTSAPQRAADAAFLLTAEVRLDNAHVVRTAVVRFTGDASNPYLILAWR